jgi:Ca2+-binding RTX toxin-like protein
MTLADRASLSLFAGGIRSWTPGSLLSETGTDAVIGGTDDPEVLVGTNEDDIIRARGGADTVYGGLGADRISGGGGHDTFAYVSALDSTGLGHDSMADFNAEKDVFQVPEAVTALDEGIVGGPLRTSNFDADLANAVDADHLGAGHAVAFIPQSGDFATETFLVVDQNGVAGYQAGEDLVLHLEDIEMLLGLTVANFTVA